LRIEPLRGNVTTRLRKLDAGDYDAVILAAAGLKRLGLEDRITRLLPPAESLPAPGQGALGVECLARRTDLVATLAVLNHAATARCVAAERAFSRSLSGSCIVPLGAYAEAEGRDLRLRGFVGAPDGSRIVSGELKGPARDPEALGVTLAKGLKAQGAGDILAALQP
jgi:hydroxymethylbilane synthase